MKKLFCILTCLIFCQLQIYGEMSWKGSHDNFSVNITISATDIKIQEELKIVLDFSFPEDFHVDIVALQKVLLRNSALMPMPFTLKSKQVEEPFRRQESRQNRQKVIFILDPQIAGKHALTFFNISFLPNEDVKKKKVDILSGIFEIKVSLPSVSPSFKGIASPLMTFSNRLPIEISHKNTQEFIDNPSLLNKESKINKEIFQGKAIPWMQMLSLILFGILFWVAKKGSPINAKKEIDKSEIIKTASQKAFDSLDALRQRNLPEQRQFDQFYVNLTNILRNYIEERYQLNVTHTTTEEFLQQFSLNPAFSLNTRQKLSNFLIVADRVKFGLYNPSVQECEMAFNSAKEFIH